MNWIRIRGERLGNVLRIVRGCVKTFDSVIDLVDF